MPFSSLYSHYLPECTFCRIPSHPDRDLSAFTPSQEPDPPVSCFQARRFDTILSPSRHNHPRSPLSSGAQPTRNVAHSHGPQPPQTIAHNETNTPRQLALTARPPLRLPSRNAHTATAPVAPRHPDSFCNPPLAPSALPICPPRAPRPAHQIWGPRAINL